MGQYCYLINRDERIKAEAYKVSLGGEDANSIEEPEKLVQFLDYCYRNNLLIECVHESFFEREADYENPDFKPYEYLPKYTQL